MSKCAYCGKEDELRPYGKDKQSICFECAMKPENKEETDRQFHTALYSAADSSTTGVVLIGGEDGPQPHLPKESSNG